MKRYKYLDDLGVERRNQYQNWFITTNRDPRQSVWKEQRKDYGIDERETWNFNDELLDYIYIHLKMLNEVNCVDYTFHKVEIEGKTKTVQDCMDEILNWFETTYYPDKGDNLFNGDVETYNKNVKEFNDSYFRILHMFIDILPYLWW